MNTTTTTLRIASIVIAALTVAFAPAISAQLSRPSQYVDRRIPQLEQEIKMQEALSEYYNLARYVGLFKQRGMKGWQQMTVEYRKDFTGWINRRRHLSAKQKQQMINEFNAALNNLKKAEAARNAALERLKAARKQLAEIHRQIEEVNRPVAPKPKVKDAQPRRAAAPILLEAVEIDLGLGFTTTRSDASDRSCGERQTYHRGGRRGALSLGGGARVDLGKLLGGLRNVDAPVFDSDEDIGFTSSSIIECEELNRPDVKLGLLDGNRASNGYWAHDESSTFQPTLPGQQLRRNSRRPATSVEIPCEKIER